MSNDKSDHVSHPEHQNQGNPPEDHPPQGPPEGHAVVIHINAKPHRLEDPVQTGLALKLLGGIPAGDVLFLKQPHEDLIVTNELKVTLKNGAQLFSQLAANYGSAAAVEPSLHPLLAGLSGAEVRPQPNGWNFVIFEHFELPDAYQPRRVRLLVKLPPTFPEAQPDMFSVSPAVRLASGASPKGTGMEPILGESWQRFSWHLQPGAWRPGISDLRDFVRCIRGRFEKRD